MTQPATISADYTLRPSELAATLALLVEARQPAMVWGAPGTAKSMIAQQVAADSGREYIDVRALLLDPVDLRGIPWRDPADRTRWAPPVFLPPTDDAGLWLINLEELPSCVPMVQAALYQLALERKVGEYALPEGASLIACGNREGDRGVVHRMPTPLASRFVHLEIRVDAEDWLAWAASNGIAPEVLFFIQLEPTLLHQFDPQSKEKAFPCPRTWHFTSNIVHRRNGLDPAVERALFRGTIGEAAAVEFAAFLKVWRELPHPRAVIGDPENADIPENASALMALCGSLYRMASDVTPEAVQIKTLPQGQGQPARPPLAWLVQRHLRDVDLDHLAPQRRCLPILGKQRHLPGPRRALHHLDRAAPRHALAVVDLAEIENLALNDPAAADPDVLHHAPVAVLLAVLEASLAAHEHGRSVRRFASPIKGGGRHYTRFWRRKARKSATLRAEKSSN